MSPDIHQHRDEDGRIKEILNVEDISFTESPLDFFFLCARYKFAVRHVKKTHKVLDAGCGRGAGSVMLARAAHSVLAVDFDQAIVEHNRAAYPEVDNLSFDTLNLLDIPQDMEPFDAVVSMDVIEHFEKAETEIVAANYAALTKDGGFAAIGTPSLNSRPYASERRKSLHKHEFLPDEFEELLGRHFRKVFLFSMTDEVVSTSFNKMAWYLMALCVK